jgi:protein O-mannosyl-transferase
MQAIVEHRPSMTRGRPLPPRTLAVAAGLAIATVLVYLPVLGHGFVTYDDPRDVTDNALVKQGLTWAGLRYAFTTGTGGNWNPLVWLSHMLDCQLWGLAAGGHHATDLVLHTTSAVLLLTVLARMTGALGASAFVAGAFALHPLHVESVAWAVERKDTLSGLFWMLTLWAYCRYAERPGPARYALVALAFACGLMSKPMVVSLPLVLLFLDYWPLGRLTPEPVPAPAPAPAAGRKGRATKPAPPPPDPRRIVVRLVLEKMPLFALVVVASGVAVEMQRQVGAVMSLGAAPLSLRLENALHSYVAYLAKTFWPTGLAVFYPYPKGYTPAEVVGAATVLAALSALAVARVRRQPYLVVGWLWYLITLVPAIGLVQVGDQAMADRFTYLPLIGVFLAVAWAAADLLDARIAAAAGAAALAACAVLTHVQLGHWETSETLYTHALAVTADNHMMHYNLGRWLEDQHRKDEAIEHYLAAARVNPGFYPPRNQLALLYAERGQTDDAIRNYREALRIEPNNAGAHNNLANFLADHGRGEEAVQEFRAAVRLKPDYVEAYSNMALALVKLGRYDEAVAEARAAIQRSPRFAQAHNVLGTALAKQGKAAEAVAEYREALRLMPGWPPAERRLAWLLATHPDAAVRNPDEALRLARHASAATQGRDPEMLDTLAAAEATSGALADAASTAAHALELANERHAAPLAADIEARLALYRAGQAYRDASLDPPR